MRRLSAVLAVTLAAATFAACAGPPETGDDEFADIDFSTADKADTTSAPTAMGALTRNLPATHSLVPTTSGYHLYTLDGTAGERLHLTLDSTAYKTYLRVTAPSGTRTSVTGIAHAGGWRSAIDPWVLPETGHYQILATAYQNMQTHPVAKAHGSYTLLAKADPQTLTVVAVGSGTVTSAPAGVTCPGTCVASFAYGTAVTLTATPGPGNHLAGWGGACTGTATTCTVVMTAARTASAMFATNRYVLSTTVAGSGGGSLAVTPAGTSCGVGCYTYVAGTLVTVTATPAANAHLAAWGGDCVGTGSTCTLTLSTARSVTAAFAADTYALAVSSSSGGVVTLTSTPASASSSVFPYGTVVTLTATPAAGYHFAAWSGDCAGSGNPCIVTMTAARSVTATFAVNTFVLVTSISGNGAIAVSPPGTSCGTGCYSYAAGTAVTLTATPAAGAHFIGWSGDCVGAGAVCTVTVNAARTVTATFASNTYTLSVPASGGGTVSVTATPTGPSATVFPYGTVVTLTATPAVGYHFAAWGGDCSGASIICSVVMTQNRTAIASFAINTYTVQINKVGSSAASGVISGSVTCPSGVASCSAGFPYGTTVTLTAVNTQLGINAEWFQFWSGGPCAGSVSPTCTFIVTGNLSMGAQFQFVIGLLERVARQLPV